MSAIRALIRRNSNLAERAILRAAVPIAYAHWEGFVKVAATGYVEYVKGHRLPIAKLQTNFAALALRKTILDCGKRPSLHNSLFERLRGELRDIGDLPPDAVDAQDNLRADVFREIVALIGLNYARYATKDTFIDRRVCDIRNEIAHGGLRPVTSSEFDDIHDGVVELMDMFHDDVVNAAQAGTFRA